MSQTTIERCGFCTATRDEVRQLVSGPAILICDKYLGEAATAMATAEAAPTAQERLETFSRHVGEYCSFCGKSAQEAKCLLHRWTERRSRGALPTAG